MGRACEEACYVVDAWVHTVYGNDTLGAQHSMMGLLCWGTMQISMYPFINHQNKKLLCEIRSSVC